jgi:glycosyltransferase involved in cell wall biosynthesis
LPTLDPPAEMSPLPTSRRPLEIARKLLRDYRYPLPKPRVSSTRSGAPTVYFCAPDYDVPSGGIRVVYRHVDLLCDAGIPAAVLHRRRGFRCTWFENRTRVVSSDDVVIGPDDLVVVSEVAASLLRALSPGIRFVVFNQNPHLTWQRVSAVEVKRYTDSPDLAAIVTVSEHSRELLEYAAPGASVIRVHNSIDPQLFHPSGASGRALTYMPRGAAEEVRQVLGILAGRGVLAGWDIVELAGMTERQVADRLRATTIFLSFAHHEGFGLPAAEAMACGAYVVGFHGFAGREYFDAQFSAPVEPGDVLALAREAERVIEREEREPGWCRAQGAAAAEFIAAEYSPDREREDVVGAYTRLLYHAASPRPLALAS